MKKWQKLLAVTGIGLSFSSWSAPWLFTLNEAKALHDGGLAEKIHYGPDAQEYGLLRLPSEKKDAYPVVVLIHGGCWKASIGQIRDIDALAEALKEMGYATWSIEYRSVDQTGGGFPGTFLDVAHGVDSLKQMAPTYHLDLKRVAVIGHSAGGHLALWAAARAKLDKKSSLYTKNPLALKGVVSMGGVPDLKLARARSEVVCKGDVIAELLGEKGKKEIPASRYAQTSPVDLLPFHVPQVLLSGQWDKVVPTESDEHYLHEAKAKGDEVRLVTIPYAGHIEHIVPNSVVWPELVRALRQMLG